MSHSHAATTKPAHACCGTHVHHAPATTPDQVVRDPVCGMTVDSATARHRAEHGGETYCFCSAGCRTKFLADPDRYLQPVPSVSDPVPAGTRYTCPMHPEVVQEGPGACPICGMALEPTIPTADEGPDPELADMTRRFIVGAVLTAPIFVLDMGGHLFGWSAGQAGNWMQLAFASPVVLWAGWPFIERGWRSLQTRHLNMFTLVALGTGAAYLFSLAVTLAPWLVPGAARAGGAAPVYFEAASVITVLVLLGQVLELRARASAGGAISALLDLSPKMARRLGSSEEEDVPLAEVRVGDRLRVRPGEAVPLDGVVLEGTSTIDEAMLTGEAIPVGKSAGDAVTGGTINGAGAFVMRAERVGADTVLARIVQMVSDAQRSRAPIQRLADTVSGWFVPAVVGVAIIAFAAWLLVGPEPRLPHALLAAVAVLIIACPCALGLATPMSVTVAVGRGASLGVLVRSAEALERLARVDALVFDKTGTVTAGRPAITAIRVAEGFAESEVLRLAASLEMSSEHPLAAAFVAAARSRALRPSEASGFEAVAGQGIRGQVEGRAVAIGAASWLASLGVDVGALSAEADRLRAEGAIAVLVAIDGRAAAAIAIADPVREGAAEAVAALAKEGMRLVMATGDNRLTAEAVARRLGIGEVQAGILPERKVEVVKALQAEGRIVAMAGDGINDAPALAAADVGIAMGTGADVAIASAGITLMGGDIAAIVRARRLAVATMRNIRQNLFFAFLYNAAGVPVAAGPLYPSFGVLLSPMLAAAAMALSSVSVIGNALRLRRTAL